MWLSDVSIHMFEGHPSLHQEGLYLKVWSYKFWCECWKVGEAMGGNWYGFVKLRSRVSDKQLLPPACWLQWPDYDIKEILWCSEIYARYTCLRHGGKKTRTAWRTEAVAPLTIIPLSPLQSSNSQNFHTVVPCLHFSKTDFSLVHLHFPCQVFVSAPSIFFQPIA